MSRRRTFFERITGTVNVEQNERYSNSRDDNYYDEYDKQPDNRVNNNYVNNNSNYQQNTDRNNLSQPKTGLGNDNDPSLNSQNSNDYTNNSSSFNNDWLPKTEHGGELSIDVYDLDDEIVLQAMIAGVRPEDLDINVTREMVTIEGHREGASGIPDDNYFHQELFWGAFNRSVTLPDEIEVEQAVANESHGLLTIRMPKLDKARSTKLKVKSRS